MVFAPSRSLRSSRLAPAIVMPFDPPIIGLRLRSASLGVGDLMCLLVMIVPPGTGSDYSSFQAGKRDACTWRYRRRDAPAAHAPARTQAIKPVLSFRFRNFHGRSDGPLRSPDLLQQTRRL